MVRSHARPRWSLQREHAALKAARAMVGELEGKLERRAKVIERLKREKESLEVALRDAKIERDCARRAHTDSLLRIETEKEKSGLKEIEIASASEKKARKKKKSREKKAPPLRHLCLVSSLGALLLVSVVVQLRRARSRS